jgi:glycosyltransferase involved in cell wall biosynthesis
VLYICVPSYNEAPTIGVLLWRIRTVFQSFPREYELVVFNDGSTDATAETLAAYSEVLPLVVLGGNDHVGYTGALEALLQHVVQACRYVRRDAVIVMQGDFTDQPEHLPELIRRFEGGADIVVAESSVDRDTPQPVRRLRRVAPWLLRHRTTVPGVRDVFGSYRLFRVAVLRDAIRAAGGGPLIHGEGWAANLDLLLATAPRARRIEAAPFPSRYDLRPRASRIRPFSDGLRLYRSARALDARHSAGTGRPT